MSNTDNTPTFETEAFRNNLKELMASRGYNMRLLSDYVGVAAATISRYLNGARFPDIYALIKIARFFNVSIDWLLGISGDKFDVLPKDVQDIAYKYSIATPNDRQVIETLLSKYEVKNDD